MQSAFIQALGRPAWSRLAWGKKAGRRGKMAWGRWVLSMTAWGKLVRDRKALGRQARRRTA